MLCGVYSNVRSGRKVIGCYVPPDVIEGCNNLSYFIILDENGCIFPRRVFAHRDGICHNRTKRGNGCSTAHIPM